MESLRWLLLLFGVIVVAGVYFYSRREQKREDAAPAVERRTPTMDAVSADVANEPDVESDLDEAFDSVEPVVGEEPPAVEQKIVTLRLVAKNRGAFKGDELILSMRGIGLRRGKFGIFHRFDGNDESGVLFSAASLVEPGHFDIENIAEQALPGISLFLVLPGPVDGVEAFDMMMEAARTLAQSLDGELLDESGSTLSIQRERYMREEIVQFEHSNLVA